jgi:hypothetical protein
MATTTTVKSVSATERDAWRTRSEQRAAELSAHGRPCKG